MKKTFAIILVVGVAVFVSVLHPFSASKKERTPAEVYQSVPGAHPKRSASVMTKIDPTEIALCVENLKRALKKEDAAALGEGLEKLATRLADHPESFSDLLPTLTETNATLSRTLTLLIEAANPDSAGGQLVLASVMGLAQRDPLAEKRQAAVAALSYARKVDSYLIESVTRIAREDVDKCVRLSAVTTIGHWRSHQPALREQLTRELCQAINASPDNAVSPKTIVR